MRCIQMSVAAGMTAGSLAAAVWAAPALAGAPPFWAPLGCGGGDALCLQACEFSVPGGVPLAKCNDYCHRGTAVCYASQIPRPTHTRVRPRDR